MSSVSLFNLIIYWTLYFLCVPNCTKIYFQIAQNGQARPSSTGSTHRLVLVKTCARCRTTGNLFVAVLLDAATNLYKAVPLVRCKLPLEAREICPNGIVEALYRFPISELVDYACLTFDSAMSRYGVISTWRTSSKSTTLLGHVVCVCQLHRFFRALLC
jgi:hypothetical protein